MKLYLIRHGQAASKDIDPEQGLTHEGKTAIIQLAQQLAQQGVQVNQVFHSGKTRARQTAEIMANMIAGNTPPQYHTNLKPDDDPAMLVADINTWTKDTLITSHLPFIPGLLNLLTNTYQPINFGPGTIACLSKKSPEWHLDWITSP